MATVKVQCENGEIYRLTLQEEASYTSVVKLVADCCPDVALFLAKGGVPCPLKYADDEGDWCTLAQATFDDFMNLQSNKRLLKLRLMSREPESPQETPVVKASKEDVPAGPPPGLENEKDELGEAGPGAWGPGGNGGGPRRLLIALHMLREAELLTPAMFASLAVQWLPLVTQRVARKVDKINHMARHGLDQNIKALLENIQAQAAQTPGLESYAGLMAEALHGNGAEKRLGEALLELLKALRGLGFEIQTHFCESVASSLLPYLECVTSIWFGDDDLSSACEPCQHPGSCCAGCGAAPIVGPRFRCPQCPQYSLCGNCYPQKIQLHGNCAGCSKDFQCMIFPAKGKGKTCRDKTEKSEKTSCAAPFDWTAWAGKGAGAGAWMGAAVGSMLAHQFGANAMGFNPAFGCPMPYPGLEQTMFEESQEAEWPCAWPKGRGKDGKGKKGKQKKGWHGYVEPEVAEFEQKVAHLLELQLANEEVIRELLVTHDGDLSQVVRVLTN